MDTAVFATVLRTSGRWRRAAVVVGAVIGGLVLAGLVGPNVPSPEL